MNNNRRTSISPSDTEPSSPCSPSAGTKRDERFFSNNGQGNNNFSHYSNNNSNETQRPIPIEKPQRRASLLDWAVQTFSPPSHHTSMSTSIRSGANVSSSVASHGEEDADLRSPISEQHGLARSLPHETSILGQVMGGGYNPSLSNASPSSMTNEHSAATSGYPGTSPGQGSLSGPPSSGHSRRRPRAFSQSAGSSRILTHDEALNLSRSGSTKVPPKQQQHDRSKGNKYDSIGLIAAYSGGPGSF